MGLLAYGQNINPVKWSTEVIKVSDNQYQLVSIATIEDGWHIYSQKATDGPIPTSFAYNTQNGAVILVEETTEEDGHIVDDPFFGVKIKFFEKSTKFIQQVETSSGISSINGTVEFMVCNDAQCLPPTQIELTFTLE